MNVSLVLRNLLFGYWQPGGISARYYLHEASYNCRLGRAKFWSKGFNMGPKPLYLGSISDTILDISIQGVPKLRSPNFRRYNFWSKIYSCIKFLKMFIALSSTCIENFSNQHSFFVFFTTFCSRCGMEWDTACRATDINFEPFYHLVRRSHFSTSTPKTTFFYFRQLKKKYFKHSSKKR